MIHNITSRTSRKRILDSLDPLVARWFAGRFERLTSAQSHALPYISRGRHTLVCTPTGSGKTLTAFLSVIDKLVRGAREGTLENRIHCVYISPLRALANDVEKNLKRPLEEIMELAREEGVDLMPIRAGVRTGDTSPYEKQKMLRKAPHILITTPETMAIAVATTRFSERLTGVETVIVDEIHELCDSKRGSLLTLTLEMLQELVGPRDFVRVGLSATISPIRDVARFLGGYRDGVTRPVHVFNDPTGRKMDLQIRLPVPDITEAPSDVVMERSMDLLAELVREGGTTVVFTNTRKRTETVVIELDKRGVKGIAAHHGSLATASRLDVENRLREGELRAVVTSTSLELGIDVGAVDLVVQLGSPKSVSRALQRAGRAGHAVGAVSRAVFIPLDRDELVELTVLLEMARRGKLDSVPIPRSPTDVLAQALIGIGLGDHTTIGDALEVVRRAAPYHDLRRKDLEKTLEFLAGGPGEGATGLRPRIWYDGDAGTFRSRRGMRRLYFLNIGTIPQENQFRAQHQLTGEVLGTLSEPFVQGLNKWDVFSLGGRPYQLVSLEGSRAVVREAPGLRPTVPSWTGEMLPRTPELSAGVGRFRRELMRRLEGSPARKGKADEGDKGGKESGEGGDREEGKEDRGGEHEDGEEGKEVGGEGEEDDQEGEEGGKEEPEDGQEGGEPDRLRGIIGGHDIGKAMRFLQVEHGLDPSAAAAVVEYFALQMRSHPAVPSADRLLVEGYIDADERKHVIFHLTAGRRITEPLARAFATSVSRAIGRDVNFAATDDGFMLSSLRTIPLEGIGRAVEPDRLEELVEEALGGSELLRARTRHAAMRSFALLRSLGGKGDRGGGRRGRWGIDRVVRSADRASGGFLTEAAVQEVMGLEWDPVGARRTLAALAGGKMEVVARDYDEVPTPFAHSMVLAGAGDLVLLEDRKALMRQLHWDVLGRIIQERQLARGRWKKELVGDHFRRRLDEALEDSTGTPADVVGRVGPCSAAELDGVKAGKEPIDGAALEKKFSRSLREAGEAGGAGENGEDGGGGKVYATAAQHGALEAGSGGADIAGIGGLVMQRLSHFGPHTAAQLAEALKVEKFTMREALDMLDRAAALWSGCATDGAAGPQYLRVEDAFALDGGEPDERTFTRRDVASFLEARYFPEGGTAGPWDHLEKFGTFTDHMEVFVRSSSFQPDLWAAMMGEGFLLSGKVGPTPGRQCWLRPEDAPLITGLRRLLEPPPGDALAEASARALKLTRRKRAMTRRDLIRELEMPRKTAASAVEWLERTGQLINSPGTHPPGGFGRPRGPPGSLVPSSDEGAARMLSPGRRPELLTAYGGAVMGGEALERAVMWAVERHGPLGEVMCARLLGTDSELARPVMERLEGEGKLERIRVLGFASQIMYISPDELAKLAAGKAGGDERMRLLPPSDPFALRLWLWRGLDHQTRHVGPPPGATGGDGGESAANGAPTGAANGAPTGAVTGAPTGAVTGAPTGAVTGAPTGAVTGAGGGAPVLRPLYGGAMPPALRPPGAHLLVKGSRILAEVYLGVTESSVEVSDILPRDVKEREWDEFAAEAMEALTGAMKFYKASGIEVLRVAGLDGIPASRLPAVQLDAAVRRGFQLEDEGLVWGTTSGGKYPRENALHVLFNASGLTPGHRFSDPGTLLKEHGPLRSDLELAFRTSDRFIGLREFARNHDLASVMVLPQQRMYTTQEEARMYRTAKDHGSDRVMSQAYRVLPADGSMGSTKWERLSDLSPTRFRKVRKHLLESTFVALTSLGNYFRISSDPSRSPEAAKKAIVLRYLRNCGMATLPMLTDFFGKALPPPDLRGALSTLEDEGEISKGYFIADDPSLYYATPAALEELQGPLASGEFVLSPRDPVYTCVKEDIRKRFGRSGLYVLFDGIEMVAGFKAAERGTRLMVDEFEGGMEERLRLERACSGRNITVVWKDEEERRREYMEMEKA